ncbi:MAG TPA: DUF5985 family protein [Thermoanaerobaculia bacterium]
MIESMISGALSAAYVVAGLFFLKFWSASRDRLFGLFAAAFFLLAIQRVILPFMDPSQATLVYLIRLVAFILIIVAIVDKNRAGR